MWYLYINHLIGKGYRDYEIISECNNLSWGNDKDTLSTQLSFDSILDLREGAYLSLFREDIVVFQGLIINKTNKSFVHSYTVSDFAFYLNKNKFVLQFNNVSASDAIKQICDSVGLNCNIVNLTTNINKLYYQETLSDIIKDILEQCKAELGTDYIMEMQGTTLYINRLEDLKLDVKLIISKDYTISRSIEDLQNKITVVNNDGAILATTEDADSINTYGLLSEILSVDDKDESQAYNIAQNTLYEKNRVKCEISFNTLDTGKGIYVNANRKIYVDFGKHGINGWHRIKSTTHTINKGIHNISLNIDFNG